jgi:hypothetical protein
MHQPNIFEMWEVGYTQHKISPGEMTIDIIS